MRIVTTSQTPQLVKALIGFIVFMMALATNSSQSLAAETKQTTVTASVPDISPPTIPILISPENNSFTTLSTPSFIWKAATSSATLSHYQLYIDDIIKYDLIPLTSVTNTQYSLVFNAITKTYTLTPLLALVDGTHSWKIVAFDTNNNFSSSAIWTFHLDSLPPLLLVEQIGPVTTNISSNNTSSVPLNPIELTDNEPQLSGTGEPLANVTVTIQVEGETPYLDNFTVGANGSWSYKLSTLPRGKIVYISFTSVDSAGNTSFISRIPIIIVTETIVFPPESEAPSGNPSPNAILTSLPIPKITIPLTYPVETVKTTVRKTISLIPESIREFGRAIVNLAKAAVVAPLVFVAPAAALVATAAIPVFTIISLLLQLGPRLFYQAIIRFLQTFGLLPLPEPQGMVFDSKTNQPVAFAILSITQVDTGKDQIPVQETVITNTDGLYQGLSLPKGFYELKVKHQDYEFPTQLNKPHYLKFTDFYKGEKVLIDSKHPPLFLIPVDFIGDETSTTKKNNKFWKLLLSRYSFNKLRVPLFIFSTGITLFYPTFTNILVVFAYLIVFGKEFIYSKREPDLAGIISDENRVNIPSVTVRIYQKDSAKLVAITQTDEKGQFSLYLDPDTYLINIMKNGYIWDELAAQSYNEITFTGESVHRNIILRKL